MALRLPEVLTLDEVRLLLQQPNMRYPTGVRDKSLLSVMVNCGLRASEALLLQTRRLDMNAGVLTVYRGKGNTDRQLWVNPETLDLVKRWLLIRPHPSTFVFCTYQGGCMSTRALRSMVKRRALKAGIQKDVHPHMLRHTFATELYRKSQNLLTVQQCLGHADISTTTIYTHLVNGEVEQAMRSFCLG